MLIDTSAKVSMGLTDVCCLATLVCAVDLIDYVRSIADGAYRVFKWKELAYLVRSFKRRGYQLFESYGKFFSFSTHVWKDDVARSNDSLQLRSFEFEISVFFGERDYRIFILEQYAFQARYFYRSLILFIVNLPRAV